MQVEPGTPFAKWFSPGDAPLPDDATAGDMYRIASLELRQVWRNLACLINPCCWCSLRTGVRKSSLK
jgi:hypothetical protein